MSGNQGVFNQGRKELTSLLHQCNLIVERLYKCARMHTPDSRADVIHPTGRVWIAVIVW
jgi:hypothetical protein